LIENDVKTTRELVIDILSKYKALTVENLVLFTGKSKSAVIKAIYELLKEGRIKRRYDIREPRKFVYMIADEELKVSFEV